MVLVSEATARARGAIHLAKRDADQRSWRSNPAGIMRDITYDLVSALNDLCNAIEALEREAENKPRPDVSLEPEPLPGPYKISPEDGNSYRIEYETPARFHRNPDGSDAMLLDEHVVLTDALGGHEMTVLKSEWETWPSGE